MTEVHRILVRNPNSGDGEKPVRARDLAVERGYDVRDSDGGDHAVRLAREAAAERPDLLVACGGDGTLNTVVTGVLEAVEDGDLDASTDVPLGVVPAGTGNDFADNVGIRGLAHAFDVLESGDERRIDLGTADDHLFLNSCVGGLTAESSARTSRRAKRRLGTLAYVLQTFAIARDFDSLSLSITAGPERDPVWSGDALMLLVGNGRRFPGERMRQANMEDGLLNVVIIEDAPTLDYLARGAADRLLRRDASHLVRLRVPHLHVEHADGPVTFSLDGEMIERSSLDLDSRPGAIRFRVGESYDPDPVEWGRTRLSR